MIYMVSPTHNYSNFTEIEAPTPEDAVRQYVERMFKRTGRDHSIQVHVSYIKDGIESHLEFTAKVNMVPIAWGPDVEITDKQYFPKR